MLHFINYELVSCFIHPFVDERDSEISFEVLCKINATYLFYLSRSLNRSAFANEQPQFTKVDNLPRHSTKLVDRFHDNVTWSLVDLAKRIRLSVKNKCERLGPWAQCLTDFHFFWSIVSPIIWDSFSMQMTYQYWSYWSFCVGAKL